MSTMVVGTVVDNLEQQVVMVLVRIAASDLLVLLGASISCLLNNGSAQKRIN